jgi:hypothetical protein
MKYKTLIAKMVQERLRIAWTLRWIHCGPRIFSIETMKIFKLINHIYVNTNISKFKSEVRSWNRRVTRRWTISFPDVRSAGSTNLWKRLNRTTFLAYIHVVLCTHCAWISLAVSREICGASGSGASGIKIWGRDWARGGPRVHHPEEIRVS